MYDARDLRDQSERYHTEFLHLVEAGVKGWASLAVGVLPPERVLRLFDGAVAEAAHLRKTKLALSALKLGSEQRDGVATTPGDGVEPALNVVICLIVMAVQPRGLSSRQILNQLHRVGYLKVDKNYVEEKLAILVDEDWVLKAGEEYRLSGRLPKKFRN